jgi:sec-independent protein translocase protein TatB
MFNIGPGELIIILILALVLLGPKRLPEVARTVGKGMRDLRRATEDIKDTVESEFYKLEHPETSKPALRAPEGRTFPVEPIASTLPALPEKPTPTGPAAGVETETSAGDPPARSS